MNSKDIRNLRAITMIIVIMVLTFVPNHDTKESVSREPVAGSPEALFLENDCTADLQKDSERVLLQWWPVKKFNKKTGDAVFADQPRVDVLGGTMFDIAYESLLDPESYTIEGGITIYGWCPASSRNA